MFWLPRKVNFLFFRFRPHREPRLPFSTFYSSVVVWNVIACLHEEPPVFPNRKDEVIWAGVMLAAGSLVLFNAELIVRFLGNLKMPDFVGGLLRSLSIAIFQKNWHHASKVSGCGSCSQVLLFVGSFCKIRFKYTLGFEDSCYPSL